MLARWRGARLLHPPEVGDVLDVRVVQSYAILGLHLQALLARQVEHRRATVQPAPHVPGNGVPLPGVLSRDPA
eukprot:12590391-Alexandrium_andersonii.AAC.1